MIVADKQKLVGQNYTTPDLIAKVTGAAKFAEDYRAEGMLFAKLLLSPMPHARIRRLDIAAETIEKIQIEWEPLPFNVDPLDTLRPGRPNARAEGNVWAPGTPTPNGP